MCLYLCVYVYVSVCVRLCVCAPVCVYVLLSSNMVPSIPDSPLFNRLQTLIARELARALNAKEPVVVNGPELLSK